MTALNIIDPKKFGYYQVGNLSVFSKIEALELSSRFNLPITWHYNDEIFSAYNWTIEPTTRLVDFYKLRAQQISQNYDYIVLFYSGGADSHNMLESFLHAGVPIDEIVSFHSFSADKDWNSEFNQEISRTAIPYVKKLRQSGRLSEHVKHRLVDMGEIINKFCQDINWSDFPYMVSSSVSINNVARSYLRKYITDWADIIDQGKKLVLVWGHDKPRIMHDQGKFFLNFMDIYDNCVSTWIQQNNPSGWYDEIFYSTPDMPSLVVKQAHVIKKFLELADADHVWLTPTVTGLGHVMKCDSNGNHIARWLTQDAQSMLIYPWFDPALYYEGKPKDIIYSKRDRWFWNDHVISKKFTTTVNGIVSSFGEKWINEDRSRGLRSTRNFRSQRYWL